ncbi:DUF3307 domain-containing protein [bacterium]|jgi:hypothetical protein|nr:DUF3307 domain-containing protein [bacterium]|tara:strand:+ start:294 stop:662 length:369 start_codon:yes stop_codon:yes gene_type:complete
MFHDAIPLIIGLLTKHMVADYYTQYSWMMRGKGTYGAFGGLAHSGWHGILTLMVLNFLGINFWWALLMGLLDSVVHYHIDYVKTNIWKSRDYTPEDHAYWMIHGTDQFLHLMTYVLILHLTF